MRWLFGLVLLLVGVVIWLFWKSSAVIERPAEPAQKTVSDRVKEFGSVVRQRLLPRFEEMGVAYPPARIVFVGLKDERELEVWVSDGGELRRLKTYPILGASGQLGPKLAEGDRQVPEGVYRIEFLNPNSRYHLSLKVSYPNAFDRAKAELEGRVNLGGDIMIHGKTASIGCLAMGDEAAEDLFVLAAESGVENIEVILSPVDFRVRTLPETLTLVPEWTPELYRQIELELLELGPAP